MPVLINANNIASFNWEAMTYDGNNYYVLKKEKDQAYKVSLFGQSFTVPKSEEVKYITRMVGTNKMEVRESLTGWSKGHLFEGKKVADVATVEAEETTDSKDEDEGKSTDQKDGGASGEETDGDGDGA